MKTVEKRPHSTIQYWPREGYPVEVPTREAIVARLVDMGYEGVEIEKIKVLVTVEMMAKKTRVERP